VQFGIGAQGRYRLWPEQTSGYAGLVYFRAADRRLGNGSLAGCGTVVVGVLLMTAGHAAMVFDQSFLTSSAADIGLSAEDVSLRRSGSLRPAR
jgi:hypothetical protein